MFCPNCGTKNADDAVFCASCGSAMNPAPAEETVPATQETVEATSTPETAAAPKKDLLAPVKPLIAKVKPFVEKNRLLVVAAAGVLVLALCIGLLCMVFGGNGYTPYKHNIMVEVEDGEIIIICDNKKAKKTGMESEGIDVTQTSIDGSIVVLLTDEGELAFVKGTKLTKIDEEVEHFQMSVDGTGVAYVTENDDGDYVLNLYSTKNKKSKVVTNNLDNTSYVIAPNGDSVCYYEADEDDDEPKLMYFKGKKSKKVASGEIFVLGMSNNGKQIYVMSENDEGDFYLYSYNTKGDRKKIGECYPSAVYFNEDHTQIAYVTYKDDYKTYISTKGKEGVKISSSAAHPMLPRNISAFSTNPSIVTYPTKNLFNKVYRCNGENGYNVWYIRKNSDKSEKLVGGVSDITLSQDGKRVYYVSKGDLKVLLVKKGDNAADKAKTLAEDVDNYIVTSNCKKVYYVEGDSLYCVNGKTGKGKKTIASEDVSSRLCINSKDVVYYSMDGDVYATKNGSKGKKVVSDGELYYGTANGVVYIADDDSLYATKGAKKPKKIFTME